MKIKELEHQTGLDRATIRYYEKEGFLEPSRGENGYRTYSPEDADTLLKIKLLRRLGFSLERVRQLQQGSADFQDALDRQIRSLEQQIQDKQRCCYICREIRESKSTYEALDAKAWLERLDKPESEKAKRNTPFQENIARPHHPVRRYVARMLDYNLLHTLILIILISIIRIRPFGKLLSFIASYGTYAVMLFVNALFLSKFRTTPGKWLMGLAAESENGVPLSFEEAFYRELAVLHFGMGWNIPVWGLICLIRSYRTYCREGQTDWDDGVEYLYKPWKTGKKAIVAVCFVALIIAVVLTAFDTGVPKYRGGELTVSQFAANYNFISDYYFENHAWNTMNGDGTFQQDPEGSVVVHMGGTPVKHVCDFEFSTADGKVTGITYSNVWNDVSILSIIDHQTIAAVYTLLLSESPENMRYIAAYMQEWEEAIKQGGSEIQFGNIGICWKYDLQNCEIISDYILATDDIKPATAGITIQISIVQ